MTTAAAVPRMRVIAGPNGSGKTTILRELQADWLGVYVNADDIQSSLTSFGQLDLASFEIAPDEHLSERLKRFLSRSALLAKVGASESVAQACELNGSVLSLPPAHINSYVAAVVADFIRRELLEAGATFTFETVMLSPDKVEFMAEAQEKGYRTYLYFVATESPDINLDRVAQRVKEGGHHVPSDKVRERYTRSIGLLDQACECADRAYIFDNSSDRHFLVAEIDDDGRMVLHSGTVPNWFTSTTLWQEYH